MREITDALPLIQSVLDDDSLPRDQHDALTKAADIIAAQGGVAAIAAERQRQIEKEGWTPAHDDQHTRGELAGAASAYAMSAAAADLVGKPGVISDPPPFFPFERSWWKPKTPREDLVRAGALCAAEIDRIDRSATRGMT